MRDPALYGSALPVEHRETQISHVFLVGDRAYKLKKELVLPFVDYGTVERRRFFCHEEIRLNRPLAPRVYIGVRAIAAGTTEFALADERDPNAVEYVVEMRRFSQEDTLASYVAGARCEPQLMRRVGAHLAGFHADAPPAPRASADTLVARVREDARQLADAAAESGDLALGIATAQAAAFTARTAPRLDDRCRRGLVREGHGDLRLEHVLVGDPLQLVDCVEFDLSLRTCDVAYDLAFAAMELHDRGVPELAAELVTGYRGAAGDPGDDALLAGMAACRALVRAKAAAMRRPRRTGELERLLALARRLFWGARCPVTVIICGPAAAGKTTLAAALAHAAGLPHLSSDVIRKERAGASATARLAPGEYTAAASRAVYEGLGERARAEAVAGGGAIVDATFRRAADRDAFSRGFAGGPGAVAVLRLAVPVAVSRARAARRAHEPTRVSDAGPEQAAIQALEFEPFDATWRARSVDLEADRPVAALEALAEAAIDAQLARYE